MNANQVRELGKATLSGSLPFPEIVSKLIAQGLPVESARFLASQFKEAGKSNLILNVYPGADHRLNGNGVSHRSEFFAELSRLLQPTLNIAGKRDVPQAARP